MGTVSHPNWPLYESKEYIEKFAASLDLSHFNPQPTTISPTEDFPALHCSKTPLYSVEQARFRSTIGGVMYVAVCTRPDIAFATSVLGRKINASARLHLFFARILVIYLLSTKELALFFRSSSYSVPLTAYRDSCWAGCRDSRKSTLGIFVTANGAAICWSSKTPHLV